MIQADRMSEMNEYPFAEKMRVCAMLSTQGKEVLNLGIGNPDLPPPVECLETLKQTASEPEAHGYQKARGIHELRKAIADWYKMYYQITLDPSNQILPALGSKEAIYLISLTFLNPGDQVLIPNPGYLNYGCAALLAGAEPRDYLLDSENDWVPDYRVLEKSDLSRVKLMWINYPHMPTGRAGSKDLFIEASRFAEKHGIILCNDNPYSLLQKTDACSLLQVEESDNLLELNSLSKSHHMAGWRIGMISGSKTLLEPVYRLFSHLHSGIFLPIQKAAITALQVDPAWRKTQNEILFQRRKAVNSLLMKLGFSISQNQEGLFVWAKAPDTLLDVAQYLEDLLYEKYIFLTPGHFFGTQGRRYVRASLCLPQEQIRAKTDSL